MGQRGESRGKPGQSRLFFVIPAQAGIQSLTRGSAETKTHVAADAALSGFPPARERRSYFYPGIAIRGGAVRGPSEAISQLRNSAIAGKSAVSSGATI